MISMSKVTLFCIKIRCILNFFTHFSFLTLTFFSSLSTFSIFFLLKPSILFQMVKTFPLIVSHSWLTLFSLGLTSPLLFFIKSYSTSSIFLSFNWSSYTRLSDNGASVWIFPSLSVTYLLMNPSRMTFLSNCQGLPKPLTTNT
jgi:hypothetical protein